MSKLILRGQSPEIKLPVTVRTADGEDAFTAVFKRGNKQTFSDEIDLSRAGEARRSTYGDDFTKRQADLDAEIKAFLSRWLVRIDGIYNATTGESENWEAADIIPVLLDSLPYQNAVVSVAWDAIRNTEIEKQRLGN